MTADVSVEYRTPLFFFDDFRMTVPFLISSGQTVLETAPAYVVYTLWPFRSIVYFLFLLIIRYCFVLLSRISFVSLNEPPFFFDMFFHGYYRRYISPYQK